LQNKVTIMSNTLSLYRLIQVGVPPDEDYPRISASESASNPDTDIILHPSIFVSVSVSES